MCSRELIMKIKDDLFYLENKESVSAIFDLTHDKRETDDIAELLEETSYVSTVRETSPKKVDEIPKPLDLQERKDLGFVPYTCPLCGYITRHKGMYCRHMEMHPARGVFICNICGHQNLYRDEHTQHIKQHKKFNCQLCDKHYTRRHDRDQHYAIKHKGKCMCIIYLILYFLVISHISLSLAYIYTFI